MVCTVRTTGHVVSAAGEGRVQWTVQVFYYTLKVNHATALSLFHVLCVGRVPTDTWGQCGSSGGPNNK